NPWNASGTGDAPTMQGSSVVIDQCLDRNGPPGARLDIRAVPNQTFSYSDGSQQTFPTLAIDVPTTCLYPRHASAYLRTSSTELTGQTNGPIYLDGSVPNQDTNSNSVPASIDSSVPRHFLYTDSAGRTVLNVQDALTPTILTLADGRVIHLTLST